MISEVENVKKGLVVSTVGFDTDKKVIGVATTNLIPGPTGIAPLEKQGAFQVQETETVDFSQAISNAQAQPVELAGQIELPVLGSTNNTLKVPETSDVISENPIQVENPANLTGFDIPNLEAIQEEPQTQQAEVVEPVALEIQMPEMPSVVVADEPSTLNESLFEGATQPESNTSILEPAATEVAEPQVTPEVQQMAETNQQPNSIPNINIEMPTIAQESQVEPTVAENVMESIPTTVPTPEVPAFDAQVPEIKNEEVKEELTQVIEEPAPIAIENAPSVVETPAEPVEETPALEETTQVEEENILADQESIAVDTIETSNDVIDEVIETYNKTMEEMIANFNKAQKELLKECIETLKKMQNVTKEVVKEQNEPSVIENTVLTVEQQVPEVVAPTPITPGNSLETAAFEIIDAMSAPKM